MQGTKSLPPYWFKSNDDVHMLLISSPPDHFAVPRDSIYFRINFLHFFHDVCKVNTLINRSWRWQMQSLGSILYHFSLPQVASWTDMFSLKLHQLSFTCQLIFSTKSFTKWLISCENDFFLMIRRTCRKQQIFKYVWASVSLMNQGKLYNSVSQMESNLWSYLERQGWCLESLYSWEILC